MSVSDKNKSQGTCMTFLGSAVIKWQHLIIGEKEQDSLYGLDKLSRKFIPDCMTFVKGLFVFIFFLSYSASVCYTPIEGKAQWTKMANQNRCPFQEPSVGGYHKSSSWSR